MGQTYEAYLQEQEINCTYHCGACCKEVRKETKQCPRCGESVNDDTDTTTDPELFGQAFGSEDWEGGEG